MPRRCSGSFFTTLAWAGGTCIATWFGEWSHGWIEQAGLIVDVTADQFETVADPVLSLVIAPGTVQVRRTGS